MIFGFPWRIVALVGAALLVIGVLSFLIHAAYTRGVSNERDKWEAQMHAAETRAHNAELALAHDVAARSEQSHTRTLERIRYVTEARQEIANAPDTETRLAAYRSIRSLLRNQAAEHLARAGADYVSSLA